MFSFFLLDLLENLFVRQTSFYLNVIFLVVARNTFLYRENSINIIDRPTKRPIDRQSNRSNFQIPPYLVSIDIEACAPRV